MKNAIFGLKKKTWFLDWNYTFFHVSGHSDPVENRPIALMNIGGVEDSTFNIQEASIGGNFDDYISDGLPELVEDLDMGTIDTMGKYLRETI